MKKRNKTHSFIIDNIKIEQFAVFEEIFDSKEVVSLYTKLEFKIDPEKQLIGNFITFNYTQKSTSFLKIEVSCHFKIDIESWNSFIDESQKKITVPRHLLNHLAVITTGTSRGVLYAKTEGTKFAKYIVPPVNLEKMIESDVTFELE